MYTLTESWDFEDFEKIKKFQFLMLFCNQNDLRVKNWFLTKLVDVNIFYGRNRKTPYESGIKFSERGTNIFFRSPIIFGRFSAGKMKFGRFCWCMIRKKFSKIDFFRFFKKWCRMCINAKYWLEMCFEHFGGPFGTIFDRLWWSEGHLEKIEFFKKMHFLRFFGIFGFGRFGCKKASKTSKCLKFSQKCNIYIPKMLGYTLNAASRCVDTILRTFENMCYFPPDWEIRLLSQNMRISQSGEKYHIFSKNRKIVSMHREAASKVSANIF